jgi:hypothetical protein
MKLRRTLHRFVTGAVTTEPPVESEAIAEIDVVDEPATPDMALQHGLVTHYARRANKRLPDLTQAPKSSPVLPIGRGTPEHEAALAIADASERAGASDPRSRSGRSRRHQQDSIRQRLIAAGL